MSIIKETQRSYKTKLNALSYKRDLLSRVEQMAKLRETEFWAPFKRHLEIIRDGSFMKIRNALRSDGGDVATEYAELKKMSGHEEVAQELLDYVEKSDEKITEVRNDIADLTEKVKEAQELEKQGLLE